MAVEMIDSGTVIDGFQVLEKLHDGSMATLYRVTRPDIVMPILMKIPKLGFGAHPACYVGFEMEQMILEKLAGPHVPTYVARGTVGDVGYLVMERVEGTSLKESASRAPLPADEVARLGCALATALRELHRQDVVHLDFKPGNVLLQPSGQAVLIDFGLSRHGGLPDLVEEEFHAPVGSGAYISPEQILGVRCEPRSDIFALGVVLYQFATGCLPFGSPTHVAGFRKRLYIDPRPPRAINPAIPEWLQEVILHCLEADLRDRYPAAALVAHDLAHPDQVPITERGRRTRRDGVVASARRWLRGLRMSPPGCPAPHARLSSAPHILVALDTELGGGALASAMRDAVRRIAASEPHYRVSCVSVIEPSLLTEEDEGRELANSLYTQRLVELRHWARPLGLPPENLRYHALDSANPAHALLEYAARNHVDLIVIGARGSSTLRRLLGSVSARVAAEATCSVTVVRA